MNVRESATDAIARRPYLVPLFACVVAAYVLVLIPAEVISLGYVPVDDARRHVAKVVSGKSWQDVLVLRDGIDMDSHPGWHAVLGVVHAATRWDTRGLLLFSVCALFYLITFLPLAGGIRPEAWLLSLTLMMAVCAGVDLRMLNGRPLLVSVAYVMLVCLVWQKLCNQHPRPGHLVLVAVGAALSTWIHCSWYLLALPIVAFVLARRWRAAVYLSACTAAGVVVGAILTGSPIRFIAGTSAHAFRAFSELPEMGLRVGEFRPMPPAPLVVAAAVLVVWLRQRRGERVSNLFRDPAFVLAAAGYLLGLRVQRFWGDWGVPAFLVWSAREFHATLTLVMPRTSLQRAALVLVAAAALYLHITPDLHGKWSRHAVGHYLSMENPEHREWLPDSGGTAYSNDMAFFYNTFYRNPHGPWKYVLGFEPTMMPEEDLRVYADVIGGGDPYRAVAPWVAKLTPADRLVLLSRSAQQPRIPSLEWCRTDDGYWIGRRPKADPVLPGSPEQQSQ